MHVKTAFGEVDASFGLARFWEVDGSPRGALRLADSRMYATKDRAPAFRALSVADERQERGERPSTAKMRCDMQDVEFLIVGAGPAGSTAAREAARAGVETLVLEKDPVVGAKRVCAAGLRPGFLRAIRFAAFDRPL